MYGWAYWTVLLGTIILFLAIFRSEIKAVIGEKKVSKILRTLPEDYRLLKNVMLKTPNGTKQIDHIILSQYGIFVIEVKNYKGCIYGTDYSEEWEQKLHGETYTFQNPIRKNYQHVKALEKQLGTAYSDFIPILVFAERAESKLATNNIVTDTPGLVEIIRDFQQVKLTKAEVIEFENIILTGKPDIPETKKTGKKEICKNTVLEEKLIEMKICPSCSGDLVNRTGKLGTFLECGSYPMCEFTMK